jgi:hypothetical protein
MMRIVLTIHIALILLASTTFTVFTAPLGGNSLQWSFYSYSFRSGFGTPYVSDYSLAVVLAYLLAFAFGVNPEPQETATPVQSHRLRLRVKRFTNERSRPMQNNAIETHRVRKLCQRMSLSLYGDRWADFYHPFRMHRIYVHQSRTRTSFVIEPPFIDASLAFGKLLSCNS